jgi:predicted membrane-bound spermidine synthase
MNASKLTALLTGLAIPVPILIVSRIGDGSFVARVIASVACLLYLVAFLAFVLGPQEWRTYRFAPQDDFSTVIVRGAAWVLGGLVGVAVANLNRGGV